MELKPGYKVTEVGVIPEDWEVVQLDKVCSMRSGEAITGSRISEHGPYPCYGGNGLRGFTTRYTHHGEYALVGRQGALCGNVTRATGKFFASEHAVVVTGFPGANIRFLTYILGAMRLNRFSESSAQPGLSVAKILKLPIAIPPTESEQRAIAEALSDVDALLAGLDRLIAKKRDLKQAVMQQLLTGWTRLPGFDGEWEEKKFGDIASIRNQKVMPPDVAADTPCVELEHIGQGDGRLRAHSTAHDASSSKYQFLPGDVLFGRLRSYLRKYWLADRAGICTTEIWPLMVDPSQLASGFLFAIVQSDRFIDAASISYGTHMPRADWGVVCNFEVRVPTLPEQTAIATVLSDMDAELAALEARRDKTLALKQGMMQDLLTGRIRLVETMANVVSADPR